MWVSFPRATSERFLFSRLTAGHPLEHPRNRKTIVNGIWGGNWAGLGASMEVNLPGCVQTLLALELKDNSKWRVPGCVQILLALELKDNSKWRVPGCVQISLALELDDNSKWRVPGCVQILLALELDGK